MSTPSWRDLTGGIDHLAGSGSPGGIGIDQAAPAAAIERRPPALGLSEAIGHSIDGSGMMAHAAMAAFDLDAFGHRGGLFHAALPRADAVSAAEDRGGRHRRRFRKRPSEPSILLVGAADARALIDAPGIGCLGIAGKRTAERDQRAHPVRHHLRQLARIESAKAPADETDLAPAGIAEFVHEIDHRILHAVAQAEIAALPPSADRVAAIPEKVPQRAG